jgi:cob(I)alamin adenosyltransferase
MKIYTRTGDDGTTGLFGGARVPKDDARVEAYGTVDELNSAIGLARALGLSPDVDDVLGLIQSELFALGAELASVPDSVPRLASSPLGEPEIQRLETTIDEMDAVLAPLKNFVLPAGSSGAAALHLARTVCRRAERCVLSAARTGPSRPELVIYLNRLSDLLFVLARRANQASGVADVAWRPRGG